ncbi:MAG: hypothetical protein ABI288_01660, partial [Ginsengibacter sp.]
FPDCSMPMSGVISRSQKPALKTGVGGFSVAKVGTTTKHPKSKVRKNFIIVFNLKIFMIIKIKNYDPIDKTVDFKETG